MAETRSEINPGAPDPTGRSYSDTDYRVEEHVYAESDASAKDKRSPEDIERDIEQTRTQMSSTINEIQERFSPQYIRRQVTEEVKETARNAGYTMIDTIKENPLPAAIAGLSIAWLFMKGRQQPSYDRDDAYRYRRSSAYPGSGSRMYAEPNASGYGYPSGAYTGGYGRQERSLGDRAHDVQDRAREAAHDVQDRAREAARDVREQVSELGETVQHKAEQFGDTIQRQTYRAQNSLEQLMDENPMALGAIALGLGAAIGMMLPSTQLENEWMGEKREQVVDAAREKAEDAFHKAESVAERAAGAVKEELKETGERIASTVKEEASKEGLTGKAGSGSGSTASGSGMASSSSYTAGSSGSGTSDKF